MPSVSYNPDTPARFAGIGRVSCRSFYNLSGENMPNQKHKSLTVNYTTLLMLMLFVLFVGLKLTGHIAWSWWLVFAPLWGWALARFVVGFIAGFVIAYRSVRRQSSGT